MPVIFQSDGVLEQVVANLQTLPSWMPATIRIHLDTLGEIAVDRMREAVAENRYTGSLEESIVHEPQDSGYTQAIYPTVKRGEYDGGELLELGTRPIPGAPWAPIARWADFRGLPVFPVWYKIRTHGAAAHPFLMRTLEGLTPHITETAVRVLSDMGEQIMHGGGTMSVPPGG